MNGGMLLAADGRRLSKRDKDLDLGELRKRVTPEQLIGTLAYAGGLIDQKCAVSARELAKEFTWDRLKGDSIYLPANLGSCILRGHGDIVGDFAGGKRSFTHKKIL